MAQRLQNFKVAILVDDGFEQSELVEPKKALEQAGAKALIVSPAKGLVTGWKDDQWGDKFNVDVPLNQARPEDFDTLLLPGGVINPDRLRMNEKAVRFAKDFFQKGKPVAAICHGPWMLVETDEARGRRLTSYTSIKTDLKNAGAQWVDEEAVTDDNLVTSRAPRDIPAFNEAMINLFARQPVGSRR